MTLDYFIQVEEGVVVEEVGVADAEEDSKLHTTNNILLLIGLVSLFLFSFMIVMYRNCQYSSDCRYNNIVKC